MSVKPIPEGYHTITPYLVVDNVEKLMDFLTTAFNAVGITCTKDSEGHATHVEMQIGDSKLMIGRTREGSPTNKSMLYLYMKDTDATYQQALTAGGKSLMEPTDQFYGDRNAGVEGPCGNQWWIATHVEDVSPEEIEKRAQTYYAKAS